MQGKRLVLTIALYIVWSQIADFGMSRDLQNESYYISQSKKIPLKWTAPEVIANYIITILNCVCIGITL